MPSIAAPPMQFTYRDGMSLNVRTENVTDGVSIGQGRHYTLDVEDLTMDRKIVPITDSPAIIEPDATGHDQLTKLEAQRDHDMREFVEMWSLYAADAATLKANKIRLREREKVLEAMLKEVELASDALTAREQAVEAKEAEVMALRRHLTIGELSDEILRIRKCSTNLMEALLATPGVPPAVLTKFMKDTQNLAVGGFR